MPKAARSIPPIAAKKKKKKAASTLQPKGHPVNPSGSGSDGPYKKQHMVAPNEKKKTKKPSNKHTTKQKSRLGRRDWPAWRQNALSTWP